jgi:hypothetical protein
MASPSNTPGDGAAVLKFLLGHEAARIAIEAKPLIEVHLKSDDSLFESSPHVTKIAIDPADLLATSRALDGIEEPVPCIVLNNVMQCLADHRSFLEACFCKLAIDGFLLVIVPHQFLYERKLRLPSRRRAAHRKLYSPNTLLADIEEALDPCEYRLRFLADNDVGYGYHVPLHADPEGGQDLVLCLQRISRPGWADELEIDEVPSRNRLGPTRILPIEAALPKRYRMAVPDTKPIDRILVVKLDHRGDFILASDAFRIFRSYFSEANITLACGSWNAKEAEGVRLFDRVVPFDFFPEDVSAAAQGISHEDLAKKFAGLLAGERYDLAVDFRLYDDTRGVLEGISARHKAGFDRGDSFPWLSIRFNVPSPTSDGRAEGGIFLANSFLTAGEHKGYEIVVNTARPFAKGQEIVWGPYQNIPAGRYRIEFLIEPLARDFRVGYDIVSNESKLKIAAGSLLVTRGNFPSVHLVANDPLDYAEFRIRAEPMPESAIQGIMLPFRFFGIRYQRQGTLSGVHQQEAMVLLSHLIPLRLRQPYLLQEA